MIQEIDKCLKKPDFNNIEVKDKYMHQMTRIRDFSIEDVDPRDGENDFLGSRFKFINAHNGLQKGHIHVLLGRTNKGKSALILEIILENAMNNITSLLFLSEGLKEDLRTQIDSLLKLKKVPPDDHQRVRQRIQIVTENDFAGSGHNEPIRWINALTRIADDIGAEIVFIDNISGIRFGNTTPMEQVEFIKYLNESTQRINAVMFIAVHQSKLTEDDSELSIGNVRANQNFTSLPSYVYGLNDFTNLEKEKRVVSILKSRNFGDAIGKYFELTYKSIKREGHYTKDKEIPKNLAKTLFINNKKFSKASFSKS